MSNRQPGDWWPCFDAPTTDAKARELAARALGVGEKQIEVMRTGGAVLTRVRQEDE